MVEVGDHAHAEARLQRIQDGAVGLGKLHGPRELAHVLGDAGLDQAGDLWPVGKVESLEQHAEALARRHLTLGAVPDLFGRPVAPDEGVEECVERHAGAQRLQDLVHEWAGGAHFTAVDADQRQVNVVEVHQRVEHVEEHCLVRSHAASIPSPDRRSHGIFPGAEYFRLRTSSTVMS